MKYFPLLTFIIGFFFAIFCRKVNDNIANEKKVEVTRNDHKTKPMFLYETDCCKYYRMQTSTGSYIYFCECTGSCNCGITR